MWIVSTDVEGVMLRSRHGSRAGALLRAVIDFYRLYPRDFPKMTREKSADDAQHGD